MATKQDGGLFPIRALISLALLRELPSVPGSTWLFPGLLPGQP
jgi:hypothetical protein